MVRIVNTFTPSERNLLGAVSYLLGPITGIGILLVEKNDPYVRFHAMQSTMVISAIFLLLFVIAIVPVGIIAIMLSPVIMMISFVLWLVLMWKAYSGEKYKLPYFGDIAQRQLEKLK